MAASHAALAVGLYLVLRIYCTAHGVCRQTVDVALQNKIFTKIGMMKANTFLISSNVHDII